MSRDVIVKKSKINGRGVFAKRSFQKGEVVLAWHPKPINATDVARLSAKTKSYVEHIGRRFYLMQSPERYVNHSCGPNTAVKNKKDVAKRDIRRGEEITSDYSGQGVEIFRCNCGSKRCKKFIN